LRISRDRSTGLSRPCFHTLVSGVSAIPRLRVLLITAESATVFIGYSLWRKKLEKFRRTFPFDEMRSGSLRIREHSAYLKATPAVVSVCERHHPLRIPHHRSRKWRWIWPNPFAEMFARKRIPNSLGLEIGPAVTGSFCSAR
jgi:hypothetical protein